MAKGRSSSNAGWLCLKVFAVGVTGGLATAAAAHTAMGPDLAAMRAHERQQQEGRAAPPRNVIRDAERHRAAERRRAVEARRKAKAADPRTRQFEVLDDKAVADYQRILQAIEGGNPEGADKAIAALENKLLLGFVLARRHLAKDAKPTYAQLVGWLNAYRDRPLAKEVHALALTLRKRNDAKPPTPKPPGALKRFPRSSNRVSIPRPAQSRRARRFAVRWERQFRRHLKRDRLTAATRMLARKDLDKRLGGGRVDLHRTMLANRLLQLGKSDKAFEFAQPAAERTGAKLTQAHWLAGLSAWHLGKNDRAAHHFAKVAMQADESDWLRSAGAYWAARAHTKLENDAKTKLWLEKAASFPRTFYGVLARHRLRQKQAFDWTAPNPPDDEIRKIRESEAGRRALALIQLDQRSAAAATLLRLYIAGGEKMSGTFAAIAEYGRLTALAYLLAKRHYRRSGKLVDVALYPLPEWMPEDGFKLDRALLFGMMRQESAFKPRAKSHAGARGLMQLMPATAAFIANDRSLRRRHVNRLFRPAFNLTLGQKFLRHLLARPAIQGNLFFAVAAYNAGEGNLNKWKLRDDPLLFIETIHLYETRGYVERVLYNLWAYRLRLGQESPSLAALAAGKWPQYIALDGKKSAKRVSGSNGQTEKEQTGKEQTGKEQTGKEQTE